VNRNGQVASSGRSIGMISATSSDSEWQRDHREERWRDERQQQARGGSRWQGVWESAATARRSKGPSSTAEQSQQMFRKYNNYRNYNCINDDLEEEGEESDASGEPMNVNIPY
jgi:hypothetical protein